MPSPVRRARTARRPLTLAATVLAALLALTLVRTTSSAAGTILTPGNFTGMGFDACAAPSATTMDKWMQAKENPYRAVGVYISGALRACSQPNLTASWISHVTSTGWHVLPLTVGPQASCTGFSKRVSDAPANTYAAAQAQGKAEAATAVTTAARLGIAPRSTLFYDMESWHTGYERCDASTLWFLSAWSKELHRQGFAAGVYSSASTGIRLLDKMAGAPPTGFVLPDQIWFAQWNDQEDTETTYLAANHWADHARVHQFYGGHNATNGGVKLNIDSNWLDVVTPTLGASPVTPPAPPPVPTPTANPTTAAPTPTTPAPTAPTSTPATTGTTGSTAAAPTLTCTSARITRTAYPRTTPTTARTLVAAAQCLLRQRHLYTARVTGVWNSATTKAVRAFQKSVHLPQRTALDSHTWTALLSAGHAPRLKLGSSKPASGVIALARALNAAAAADLHGTGYFGDLTKAALKRYQRGVFGSGNGVADARTWTALHRGRALPAKATTTARVVADPSPSSSPTLPPTAQDPALAKAPAHRAVQHSIGIKAPVRKAAPALPKARQLTVPRMVPHAAPVHVVHTPLFSTALQARMWDVMSLLDASASKAVGALVPWLLEAGSGEGS